MEMVLYSEDTERMLVNNIWKIARIPEKAKLINVVHFSSPKLKEVRIPMNVKVICEQLDLNDYRGGIPRGDDCTFAVDGNNTNYYSIFGVLFTYTFYNAKRNYIFSSESCYAESGKHMLMA